MFGTGLLDGLHVTVTAGPTREALDPVRYISNHSSGKMGFAIARAAADAGALTTLISGPVNLETPERVERVDVVSARDMQAAALATLEACDIFIGCAAVADYRAATTAEQKIKKSAQNMTIALVRNPDIIAAVASHQARPYTVGFAAETQDVERYALDKLRRKNLDMIVANDVSNELAGFNSDNNAASILWEGGRHNVDLTAKRQLARVLIETIAAQYVH
jgi:phosphopantothenoylcysteine decarboxylase/phosphopantothenate--cysteine ligase